MTEERGNGLAVDYAPLMDKWLVLRGRGPVTERAIVGAYPTRGAAINACNEMATPHARLEAAWRRINRGDR